MTSYELSISSDYVPSWGIVEAMRELYQNALDEETRDPENKMFHYYDSAAGKLYIGNKNGKLDAKTLLLGYSEKRDQDQMIGQHGEGYKIATVVLLRLNKQVTFYNYGKREIWKPRFVKSRKYGGVRVPTFFVEKKPIWESVPDNDLIIEVSGITSEEIHQIRESNLHMVGKDSYEYISTYYGDILKSDKHKSKVFVGGLYICDAPDLDELGIGVDFLPRFVRLERDRTMVDTFDIRYYASKMIEKSGDEDLIARSLSTKAGEYIFYDNVQEFGDKLARQFLNEHGKNAVPVSDQKDVALSLSTNTIVVPKQMRDLLLASLYYQANVELESTDESTISARFLSLFKRIQSRISEDEATEFSDILRDLIKLEKSVDKSPGEI